MGGTESTQRRQFDEYFALRREAVRRTAYLLCGDWHWADDLTQSAFLRLMRAWSRVRDDGALDAFVRTCLVRAYLRETRRVWRRRERTIPVSSDIRQADDTAIQADDRIAFAAALRRLPAGQRAVLICRYYMDLDVAATAEMLGCAPGTVKSRATRALAVLRDRLGEEFMDDGTRRSLLRRTP